MPSSQSPPPNLKYLHLDDLPSDRKNLVASLPSHLVFPGIYLHQYQGFWHITRQLMGVLSCQDHFQALDTDILLVSTPKSGVTWLKSLAFAILKRDAFPDLERHPLLTSNPHTLVPFMEYEHIESDSPDLGRFGFPRLLSTHLPVVSLPKTVVNSSCKIVYLCRNPSDVFISLWHFANKLLPSGIDEISLEQALMDFTKGISLHGPFWDHVLGYWKKSREDPTRVLFLTFEELIKDPGETVKLLADFFGCPFRPEEVAGGLVDDIVKLCSFEHLRNLDVNRLGNLPTGESNSAFFRRGEVGDASNFLTSEQVNLIDQITEEKFGGSQLKL